MKNLKLNQKEKVFKLSFLATILFGALISCSDENSSLEENTSSINEIKQRIQLNLSEQVVVTETTTFVSELFFNMGVTEVEVTRDNNLTVFRAITEKTFFLKEQNVDLADYPIVLEGEFLRLNNSNSTMRLSISEDRPYIESSSYEGFVEDNYFFNSIEFNVLIFFMNELTLEFADKFNATPATGNPTTGTQGSCSFWGTYYVYGTGISSSVAQANLQSEIDTYTGFFGPLLGCSPIGGADTSCLWGNHACVSTQAYCCD